MVHGVGLSSPDDGLRWAVSGSSDATLKLWDLKARECAHTLEGHGDAVWAVAISSAHGGCHWALSCSSDATLKLWDLKSRECARTLEGHRDSVYAVALSSADGGRRWALSGSGDTTLRLWDLQSGNCARTFEGHRAPVYAVAISSAGGGRCWALSGSYDWTLRLWDLFTGACVRTLTGHKDSVLAVAISHADGGCAWALSGSYDKTLKLWDLKSGECARTLKGHKGAVNSVALSSADGGRRWALSGSNDRTLRLWDLRSGDCTRTLDGHAAPVLAVALSSADGGVRWAVSGARCEELRLWDLQKLRPSSVRLPGAPARDAPARDAPARDVEQTERAAGIAVGELVSGLADAPTELAHAVRALALARAAAAAAAGEDAVGGALVSAHVALLANPLPLGATAGLDAFEAASKAVLPAREALDAALLALAGASSDALETARDERRAELACALDLVSRTYCAGKLRKEEGMLMHTADAIRSACDHTLAIALARGALRPPPLPVDDDVSQNANAVEACGAAKAACEAWRAAHEPAEIERVANAALERAWASLEYVGAQRGSEDACALWRRARADAHAAIDAELAARTLAPHALASLPVVELACASRLLAAACLARAAIAGVARNLALAARFEAAELRSLDGAATLANQVLDERGAAVDDAEEKLDYAIIAANAAERKAPRGTTSAVIDAAAAVSLCRAHVQRAVRSREAAAARLLALAQGPFPELLAKLPEECKALAGLSAALRELECDRRLVQYEPLSWPRPELVPPARSHITLHRFEQSAVVLKEFTLADERQRNAFRLAAEQLAALAHPHVLRLQALFFDKGKGYFQLEFCEGGTLACWLERPELARAPDSALVRCAAGTLWSPLHERVAPLRVRAIRQLLEAICHVHAHGAVHGDVKLENALVALGGGGDADDWRVLLADFELSRGKESAAHGPATTRCGAGTSGYMAPEVARGGRATAASDVFAFGICAVLALAADAPTRAAVLASADTSRALAAALGSRELLAALDELPERRPSADALKQASLFNVSDAILRRQADVREAEVRRRARSCVICWTDGIDEAEGLTCASIDDRAGQTHFTCDGCLSDHILNRAGQLDERGCAPCALGDTCARRGGYSEWQLGRHVSQEALRAIVDARHARLQADIERDNDRRVRELAAEFAALSTNERRLREARTHIEERILTLACPRCGQAFAESLDRERGFNGCCALSCARAGCGCAFCAYCLADCGNDAHGHVRQCALGEGLWSERAGFERAQRARRERSLRAYLAEAFGSDADGDLRASVLAEVAPLLREHGLCAQELLRTC